MKFTKNLVFLLVPFAFIGCESSKSTLPPVSDNAEEDTVETQPAEETGSLVDRYISGEIPGYRE